MPDQGSSGSSKKSSLLNAKVGEGKYEIRKKLGAGCFGEVYKAVIIATDTEVAVKVEDAQSQSPQLEVEATALNILRQPVQPQGFAEYYFYGREGNYFVMVMEILGKSLEDMLQSCPKRKFTIKTAALVGKQVVHRIEYLHSKGIVHRDIKPENFMFGVGGKVHHVYVIDFGLCKKYWDTAHVQCRQKLSLTGTARYASINAHRGTEQSRRDDLEAIGHMILYFIRGSLPWSGLDAKTKQEKYRKIMDKKITTALSDLCQGFPKPFEDYLSYARELQFNARPDYDKCQSYFAEILREIEEDQNGVAKIKDYDFEWFDPSRHGQLVPLQPRARIMQPDDSNPTPAPKWRLCFCGSTKNVRD
eukprot:TRINITY_DN2763_c0_g1_i2.p1 TRINITY_DN2763_c0_g1~~TRINITY_DN2763_c0_g1_i2.p1  ORF type:complete len:360 (-),score=50.86 TRINITY_DN2763_c0_g1_i2:630-1709(-)